MSDESDNQGSEVNQQQLEQDASAMGWTPKDKFRGDPEKWVDAAEFIERGQHLMPILKENNKRLQRELLTRDQKIDTLTQRLDGATVALNKLEKHYTEANKRAVEVARNDLKEQLKQAREDRDVDAEVEILGSLNKLDQVVPDQTPPDTSGTSNQDQPAANPVFQAWLKDNSWFGPDKKKTKAVSRIAEDLRDEGSELQGREFMDECVRIYEEQQEPGHSQEPPNQRPSKVEGAQPRSHSTGKTFADLPADAKAACLADADDLVGPNKRYKTLDEWKKGYASIYFTS